MDIFHEALQCVKHIGKETSHLVSYLHVLELWSPSEREANKLTGQIFISIPFGENSSEYSTVLKQKHNFDINCNGQKL